MGLPHTVESVAILQEKARRSLILLWRGKRRGGPEHLGNFGGGFSSDTVQRETRLREMFCGWAEPAGVSDCQQMSAGGWCSDARAALLMRQQRENKESRLFVFSLLRTSRGTVET